MECSFKMNKVGLFFFFFGTLKKSYLDPDLDPDLDKSSGFMSVLLLFTIVANPIFLIPILIANTFDLLQSWTK